MPYKLPGDQSPTRFNLRAIGPEPPGATPIAPEDLQGLIPDFVATRSDLNIVEFENITKTLQWACSERGRWDRARSTHSLLS